MIRTIAASTMALSSSKDTASPTKRSARCFLGGLCLERDSWNISVGFLYDRHGDSDAGRFAHEGHRRVEAEGQAHTERGGVALRDLRNGGLCPLGLIAGLGRWSDLN